MRNKSVPNMTDNQSVQQNDITKNQEEQKENALDEALKESFPASDPIAITIEKLRTSQAGNGVVKLGDELQ